MNAASRPRAPLADDTAPGEPGIKEGGPSFDPASIPLGLYVHLPWCLKKCPYCDFNSHVTATSLDRLWPRYQRALEQDLLTEAGRDLGRRRLASVFFGGGTPSLAPPTLIESLLRIADRHIGLAADCEITLESNPGAVDRGAFGDFRAAGVNRLSIGVQSFSDSMLSALGRIHGEAESRSAFKCARRAGFDNINIDLMHSLPRQSLAGALDDLKQALELGPEHLSWYQLTLEPGTPFARRPPPLPPEDTTIEIAERGSEVLTQNGFQRYEISAWARSKNRRCRHNLGYWQYGDFLGIGAGAHGKLTTATAVERSVKPKVPGRYMESLEPGAHPCQSAENSQPERVRGDLWERSLHTLSEADLRFEFMLNATRLVEGVSLDLIASRTGQSWRDFATRLAPLEKQGLVTSDNNCLRPTPRGLVFNNELAQAFL